MSFEKMFHLDNISKRYGKTLAVSSHSFHVKKGELVALIGPSGSGKTTLLNILGTQVKPDEGNLLIDNLPACHYASDRRFSRKVGIVRQQFDLVNQLPVIHNVLAGRLGEWGFFRSFLSLILPQDKSMAIHALERVGLLDILYERTSNLSGGEQQRVAMARLLVQKPEVVLADEPVSSLDPARAEDIIQMLVQLVQEESQTLIASLHSVEYARRYFSRIIALKNGEIHFDLPAHAVSDKHLDGLYSLEG